MPDHNRDYPDKAFHPARQVSRGMFGKDRNPGRTPERLAEAVHYEQPDTGEIASYLGRRILGGGDTEG